MVKASTLSDDNTITHSNVNVPNATSATATIIGAGNEDEILILTNTNHLLRTVGVASPPLPSFTSLQKSASSMFVAIFEAMFQVRLKTIIRKPKIIKDYIYNAQSVIDSLGSSILNMSLSHITGGAIVGGDKGSIGNLVDIFAGISEVWLKRRFQKDALGRTRLDGGGVGLEGDSVNVNVNVNVGEEGVNEYSSDSIGRREARTRTQSRERNRDRSRSSSASGGRRHNYERQQQQQLQQQQQQQQLNVNSIESANKKTTAVPKLNLRNKPSPSSSSSVPPLPPPTANADINNSNSRLPNFWEDDLLHNDNRPVSRISRTRGRPQSARGRSINLRGLGDTVKTTESEKLETGDVEIQNNDEMNTSPITSNNPSAQEIHERIKGVAEEYPSMWRSLNDGSINAPPPPPQANLTKAKPTRLELHSTRLAAERYAKQQSTYKSLLKDRIVRLKLKSILSNKKEIMKNKSDIHHRKVLQIKVDKEGVKVANIRKSRTLKRTSQSEIRLRKLYLSMIKSLHESKRESECSDYEGLIELKKRASDKAKVVDDFFLERIKMVVEAIEVAEADRFEQKSGEETALRLLLSSLASDRTNKITAALQKSEQFESANLLNSAESTIPLAHVLGVEDWNGIYKDRFMSPTLEDVKAVERRVEVEVRRKGGGGLRLGVSEGEKRKKEMMLRSVYGGGR